MIALLVALGLAALISLQPWASNTVAPQLSVAPGLGIALGDSVEVAPGRQLAVAPAQPALGGKSGVAAGEVTVGDYAAPPELRIAVARVVESPHPGHPPSRSPEPPPSQPAPIPPPSPAPQVVPVAAPTPAAPPESIAAPSRPSPSSQPSGPVTSGPGPVKRDPDPIEVREGEEYAFSFSFLIEPTVYRAPGSENLILQIRSADGAIPSFALQLWDDGSGSERGLWASGDAMGGERFLAPVVEGEWHRAVVYFRVASEGDGFYLLLLDGQPIDARGWVSLLDPDNSSAQIEVGLFRDGERVVDAPDILFGPTQLGETLESVIP